MGGVSPGCFICRELAGRERCKTALAASLSEPEQPQAGVKSLLCSHTPALYLPKTSYFCSDQAAGWKLLIWTLLGAGCTPGHGGSGQGVSPFCSDDEHNCWRRAARSRLPQGLSPGSAPFPVHQQGLNHQLLAAITICTSWG